MRQAYGDQQDYAKGQYTAYASPWSTLPGGAHENLVRGYDYADTITVNPATFPNGTKIRTSLPGLNDLFGYFFIAHGDYEYNNPIVPVAPVRVSNLVEFSVSFSMTISGDANNTVMTSAWLWDNGPRTNRTHEISVYSHFSTSALSYFNSRPLIGTYTDTSGQQWTCRDASPNSYGIPYFMFGKAGGGDYLTGSFDLKAALQYLVGLGKITDQSVWATGSALGREPYDNASDLDFLQFDARLS